MQNHDRSLRTTACIGHDAVSEQAPWRLAQTASKFVVKHNNIIVVPNYAVDSGWWPDAMKRKMEIIKSMRKL